MCTMIGFVLKLRMDEIFNFYFTFHFAKEQKFIISTGRAILIC